MIVWILIAILAIVTFVAAYYASRTWHWANVTLTVLIFLSSILFVVLTAKVIQIRQEFGKRIAQAEQDLEELQNLNTALLEGTENSQMIGRLSADEVRIREGAEQIPGIQELDHRLHLRTRLRGRVWRGVVPAGPVDDASGAVPVTIQAPRPHGVDQNTIVHVFEMGNPSEEAEYLGEFRVLEEAAEGVTLQPVLELDGARADRLAASSGPWAMHESMPVDEHELFEPLTDEQLSQMLPAESVEEYVRHGNEPTADDSEWSIATFDQEGNRVGPEDAEGAAPGTLRREYQRTLRDYAYLFQELANERIVTLADIAAVEKDNARLEQSQVGARQLQAHREDEIEKLSVDLAGVRRDRTAIESHLATLGRQVRRAQQLLVDTLQDNGQAAEALTQIQVGIEELIRQQTAVSSSTDSVALDAGER